MDNINEKSSWIRPWNREAFDDLYNRDDRFFSIVIKGLLSWLNGNIILYNKPITHFIFNTGSSYLYVENNGYEYTVNEASGEDWLYHHMPRCVVTLNSIDVPTEELSSPYSRGVYERQDRNDIKSYNAQMRRLPIEFDIDLQYILSNTNEALILVEELLNRMAFQQYFSIVYLGREIECSFETPGDFKIEFNKIDMTSSETNQKTLDVNVRLLTNYPLIDERTEIPTDKVISKFASDMLVIKNNVAEKSTRIIE